MGNNHPTVKFNNHTITQGLLMRLVAAEKELIRLNEKERLNMVDMAIAMNISEDTLKRWIKILGIKLLHKKPWSNVDKSKWHEIILPMTKKGMLYKDIAKKVNSSTSVVYNWCVREGIDRKTTCRNWHSRHNKQNENTKRTS